MAINTDSAPFEIIVAPYEVWLAPTGEPFPAVEEAPTGNWDLLGTLGNKRYSEDGVTVAMNQDVQFYRVAGLTQPVKASRTSEDMVVSLQLMDLSLEQFTKQIQDIAPTDVAAGASSGSAGYKSIELDRGTSVKDFAVLVRGNSPYGPAATGNWNAQFQLYRAVVSGNPSIQLTKGQAAMLAFEFTTIYDPTTGLVATYVAQDADPA